MATTYSPTTEPAHVASPISIRTIHGHEFGAASTPPTIRSSPETRLLKSLLPQVFIPDGSTSEVIASNAGYATVVDVIVDGGIVVDALVIMAFSISCL